VGTSSNSTPDTFRKVNAIITLRSEKEIDNYVGNNLNEKSKTPPTTADADSEEFKEDEHIVILTTPQSKFTPISPMQS